MNRVLLANAAWRIHSEGGGLWANIFDDKYLKGNSILEYKKGSSLSPFWRGICDGRSLLEKGLLWRVGDGATIRFWLDDWLGVGPLSTYAVTALSDEVLSQKVNEYLYQSG